MKRRKKPVISSDPADQFTHEDIGIIRFYLYQILQCQEKITAANTYSIVSDYLSNGFSESQFKMILGLNFKNGRIAGYTTSKGRNGGIRMVDIDIASRDIPEVPPKKARSLVALANEEPESPEIEPELEPQPQPEPEPEPELIKSITKPIPKTSSKPVESKKIRVTLDGLSYSVPANGNHLKTLIHDIFECSENPNGNLDYDGKTYQCNESALMGKFLFYYFEGALSSHDFSKALDIWQNRQWS